MNNPLRSLWGALVGDACGAFLEGLGGTIDPDRIRLAMELPGGGRMATGAGQITDDGELSLALWNVLRRSDINDGFPGKEVATAYAAWYDSMPFDIGQTCSQAFEKFQDAVEQDERMENFHDLLQAIDLMNKGSEANGAMMRATPIAVWYASQTFQREVSWTAQHAAVAAADDARLSHSGHVAQDANAVYVYALTLLLQNCTPKETLLFIQSYIPVKCDTVQSWFNDSNKKWMEWGSAQIQVGHVKHAFTMAMWFLRHPEIGYEEAIRMVLQQGGDTDTNAAIVGGLVACYHSIPERMKQIVHSFDSTTAGVLGNKGHQRPTAYCVKYQLQRL